MSARAQFAVRLARPLLRLTGVTAVGLSLALFLLGALVAGLAYGPIYDAVCNENQVGECVSETDSVVLLAFAGVACALLSLLFIPVALVHVTQVRAHRREEGLSAPRAAALDSWRVAQYVTHAQHDDLSRRMAAFARGEHGAQVVRQAGAMITAFAMALAFVAMAVALVSSMAWSDANWCSQDSTCPAVKAIGVGAGTTAVVSIGAVVLGIATNVSGRRAERKAREVFEDDWRAVVQHAAAPRVAGSRQRLSEFTRPA